ncbi:conserved Plasmodium protein, unknown function [Plasmodium malariae]|uniref:CH-like domain-containing protein n=1 Tax=Plasmodium malariae TaxID=5858 RepID=A0A1D3SPY5_PLAMA|nr:conserved Plasmodium protein, unknown function [Plasmodium malariae]SCO93947.1 conserved Plasmodium protein, unknown function [Plasmodium malariae]
MDLPREIIKWFQYLNLPYSFKNIKNASNGIIISEIINTYIPQSINMNSLENGFSKEIKKKNWQIIKRTLRSLNISFDETSIINSDKNAIINLFIQLYEYFNENKSKNESYCIKEENNELNVPSFARSTITQKVRESNVHDIVDEEKKMMSTYEIIKREEYHNAMIKEKGKEEKENKNKRKCKNKKPGLNETSLFYELEKSSSIITINDTSNYEDYTDIKTLDSFVKDKNNLTSLSFMKNEKELNENERQKILKKNFEENVSNYTIEKEYKNELIKTTKKMYKFYHMSNFELYDDENTNNLYETFYALCSSKKYELLSKILDQLKDFNENFYKILSLKPYHFFHIWKLFYPVISSSRCDCKVFTLIMEYMKELLSYVKINDLTSVEIFCNIILRSLFIIDNNENKDVKCFCELIILMINKDRHTLLNILSIIKNTMSLNFFYLFLSTLLKDSSNAFIFKKDVKDIYLYYTFVGLHTNKENIMLYSLDILNTLSLLDNCHEIVLLSSLLLNILEINNINYNIFLFSISSNIVSKLIENQGENEYKAEIKQFIKICSVILKNAKTKQLLYLILIYSHKLINKDDTFFDIYLRKLSELSDEEHKVFISSDIFEVLFKKMCIYKIIKKYFSSIFNENLNVLNQKNNDAVLHLLLAKEKWKEELFLRILKNYIIYNRKMELTRYLEIYNQIFKYTIQNLFSENEQYFELSKDILNFFWFSLNEELKVKSFEMSSSYLKDLCKTNKHILNLHTKEYLKKLENDAYFNSFVN